MLLVRRLLATTTPTRVSLSAPTSTRSKSQVFSECHAHAARRTSCLHPLRVSGQCSTVLEKEHARSRCRSPVDNHFLETSRQARRVRNASCASKSGSRLLLPVNALVAPDRDAKSGRAKPTPEEASIEYLDLRVNYSHISPMNTYLSHEQPSNR